MPIVRVHLIPALGREALNRLTPADIRKFLADYPEYCAMLHRSLRPGGRLLLQQMSRGRAKPGGGAFIESCIAPDMITHPLPATLAHLELKTLSFLVLLNVFVTLGMGRDSALAAQNARLADAEKQLAHAVAELDSDRLAAIVKGTAALSGCGELRAG